MFEPVGPRLEVAGPREGRRDGEGVAGGDRVAGDLEAVAGLYGGNLPSA